MKIASKSAKLIVLIDMLRTNFEHDKNDLKFFKITPSHAIIL